MTLPRATHFLRVIQSYVASPDDPEAFAAKAWGAESLAATMCRARRIRSNVPSLNSADDSALVADVLEVELFERIVERSVLAQLATRSVPFFARLNQVENGSAAFWTAEGGSVGVTSLRIGGVVTLRPRMVGNISVVSDELARNSRPRATAAIGHDATTGVGNAISAALLDPGNAGSDVKPRSILNGVSAQETFSDLLANFSGDTSRAHWIAQPQMWLSLQSSKNPDLGLGGGRFAGAPAISSRHAPAGGLVLVDPGGIAVARGALAFDASKQASLVMDSEPAMDVGTGSPPTPTPAQMVSCWQCGCTALKLTTYVNWEAMPGAVGFLVYGSPGSPA